MIEPVYQRRCNRAPCRDSGNDHWFRCWLREERRTWALVLWAAVLITVFKCLF